MRILNVTTVHGLGPRVLEIVFSSGIRSASMRETEVYSADGLKEIRDRLEVETSTPKAKRLVDSILAAEFYDPSAVKIVTRQARAIVGDEDIRELTYPLVEPSTDFYDEVWQFTHVTFGVVGRILISACLLAYGMIEANILLMIGGLLFLPLLPVILGISYGLLGRRFRLTKAGFLYLFVAVVILFAGGLVVGSLVGPPMKYTDLASPLSGILISLAVGVAAALASVDDAGRRELIGLAAASQIGIVPVWLGIVLVHGVPTEVGGHVVLTKIASTVGNFIALISGIMATQYLTGIVGEIRRVR